MAKQMGNARWAFAGLSEQRRDRVSQCIRTYFGQTGVPTDSLQVPAYVWRVEQRPVLRWEHKLRMRPLCCLHLSGQYGRTLRLENLDSSRRQLQDRPVHAADPTVLVNQLFT